MKFTLKIMRFVIFKAQISVLAMLIFYLHKDLLEFQEIITIWRVLRVFNFIYSYISHIY